MAETGCICNVENPEWVGYGSCGHQNICSTCLARSRFLHQDLRCYSCMTELDIVFITKAYGDLNERITNFPTFLPNPKEGLVVGMYWYHADTKAFFDNFNEYKRIKELCRLSCICDRNLFFTCVGALMTHLHNEHNVYMCTICLVWRHLFISEQKLFTWEQLNQHIRTGDATVDLKALLKGESFTGHPYCEDCRNPFYGDKQVYVHLSTGSCPCHICIRLYPILHRDDEEVEDHFYKHHIHHIREKNQYWHDNFPIIRAFYLDKDLQKHKANVHGQSTSKNPYESFRLEPVYEYTHGPIVPPIYCPPLVSQAQAPLASSSSLNTTESSSYQDQSRSRQNWSEYTRFITSSDYARFGMTGTSLDSSLNTTRSSSSAQDHSRSRQNSDISSFSQAGFLASSDYARFGITGTLLASSLNTTQSSSRSRQNSNQAQSSASSAVTQTSSASGNSNGRRNSSQASSKVQRTNDSQRGRRQH